MKFLVGVNFVEPGLPTANGDSVLTLMDYKHSFIITRATVSVLFVDAML